MYKPTSRQQGLFEPHTQLDEHRQRRLKASWAETFRRKVYPVLLESEELFADLYDPTQGRSTWSVARKVGLVLLREMLNLGSDQAVVDALAFDVRWQHALGLEEGQQAYLSRRSLVDFRTRLHREDPESQRIRTLFERIGDAAVEDLGVERGKQRIDSTFLRSNIARRGREALLNEALRRLVQAAIELGLDSKLPERVRSWFARQQGWGQTLEESAEWLDRVLEELAGTELSEHPTFKQAAVVLDQQTERVDISEGKGGEESGGCSGEASTQESASTPNENATQRAEPAHVSEDEPSEDGPPDEEPPTPGLGKTKKRKARAKTSPTSIHSLHDTDAHRGHKGTGYLATIVETSGNETEIITAVRVAPANKSDQHMALVLIEDLAKQDKLPETLLADAGYTSGKNLVEASRQGVQLVGPVVRARPNDHLNRCDFTFDDSGHVVACPRGHAPVAHTERKPHDRDGRSLHVLFDRTTCDACPAREQCPVRRKPSHPGAAAYLDIDPRAMAHDERQRVQQTPEWRAIYKDRSGIEATNSELKRAHSFGQLSVRGRHKVLNRVLLKVIGCNIKRWCAASLRRAAAPEGQAPEGPEGPQRPSTAPARPQILRAARIGRYRHSPALAVRSEWIFHSTAPRIAA